MVVGRSCPGPFVYRHERDFDVTLTREDPCGPVKICVRERATGVKTAVRLVLERLDAISKHDWNVVGVWDYAGELGR